MFRGKKERTVGGLKKSDLKKNKRGRVVSKKQSSAAQKKLGGWLAALAKARKDLKIKGSSSVVKVGTRVKNIRLVEGDHDIDCRIDGIGAMQLKSEFVKKV